MSHRIPITVKLDAFEGPLDLLLYLIQSHEMDISRVAIRQITDQYLEYVRLMQELDFDIASEFLVMAATLLLWKSKALLPQEKVEGATADDAMALSQEDLIRQLLEHQRFLEAGAQLNELPQLGDEVFRRSRQRTPIERVWREMDITDLALTYQDILARERKRTTVLRKETVSLSGKIREFGERLTPGQMQKLRALLSAEPTRAEEVVTFLASLELGRLKKLKLYQEEVYADIYVELLESLRNFDPQLLTGFDHPPETAAVPSEATSTPAQVESSPSPAGTA